MTFPGGQVLNSINVEMRPGEVRAIVGQNGSGKSTFVKILAGYHKPDSGSVVLVGSHPLVFGSSAASEAVGMRFVHQDLGLISDMSVSDNFRLGGKHSGRILAPLDRQTERRDVVSGLKRLGCDLDPRANVGSLSAAERTAVAVARALDKWEVGVAVLVLDEVTASMPWSEATKLFGWVREIAATGVAVLFISHHLDEVLSFADSVTVLRDGREVLTSSVTEIAHGDLVEALLGRALIVAEKAHTAVMDASFDEEDVVFEAKSVRGDAVEALNLQLHRREVVGIAGLAGSGRDVLAGLLAGHLPRAGEVRVLGEVLPPGEPHAAIKMGLCCVPSDRMAKALLPTADVRENITLSDLHRFWHHWYFNRRAEVDEAEVWLDRLAIRPRRVSAPILTLSGGNLQKVVLARSLRVSPKVLVLDEPTQGVDIGAKVDIYDLVGQAVDHGTGVLICSSDADELATLCTRVLVMHRGFVVSELVGSTLTPENIIQEQVRATSAVQCG